MTAADERYNDALTELRGHLGGMRQDLWMTLDEAVGERLAEAQDRGIDITFDVLRRITQLEAGR